jgi:hypothetical protein
MGKHVIRAMQRRRNAIQTARCQSAVTALSIKLLAKFATTAIATATTRVLRTVAQPVVATVY